MNCMAVYIDKNGEKKKYYWVSSDYGSRKDAEKHMKEDNIEYKEILETWSSD